MQMYRGLPIITNKIATEEQRGIPHHLLGTIGLEEPAWDVHAFRTEANKIIHEIRSRGKLPIVVGGTHFYTDGLLFENHLVEDVVDGTLPRDAEDHDVAFPILNGSTDDMFVKLKEVDPVMADRWHPNDRRKIRRSLEIYLTTGKRASDIYAEQKQRKADPPPTSGISWRSLLLWVYSEPTVLEERLYARISKMVDNGLLDETQQMHDYLQGRLRNGETIDRTKGIWQSIGFKEMEPYLTLVNEDAGSEWLPKLRIAGLETMKIRTRRYAKEQLRWIKHKTIPRLKEAGALDHLFVLDSTDVSQWEEAVAEPAVRLARQFLRGEELPSPTETSETAAEVLSLMIDASKKDQSAPCHKTCEICQSTHLTEQLWEGHLRSNRHRRMVQRKKRRAPAVLRGEETAEDAERRVAAADSPSASRPTAETFHMR